MKQRLGVLALGAILLIGTVAYSTFQFGHVEGVEFSPRDFKRREFDYYEVPLVGLQVTPIRRADSTGDLEDYLLQNAFVTVAATAAQRWDLIVARRGFTVFAHSDAHILAQYLDASRQDDRLVWLEWTKQHPEAAHILWPIVARLAEQELYFFLPELFALAELTTADPVAFEKQLQRTLVEKYLRLADTQLELGQHRQAIELFDEALQHNSDAVAALEGRATAAEALGDVERARTDRQRARQLRSQLVESPDHS